MFNTIVTFQDLERQFGSFETSGQPGLPPRTTHDLVGARYAQLVAEMAAITAHQWTTAVPGPVRGYLLSGPPGVGKTSLVRRIAYELGRRFLREDGESDVVLALIDGSDIARARYGESEERIREVFRAARSGMMGASRSIILFDDVESILMARGSSNAKEWHFSQDSVFFHGVDELDTRSSAIFLTTNRADLVDEAIVDRFLSYSLPRPGKDVLLSVAIQQAERQGIADEDLPQLREAVSQAVDSGSSVSVRDAERMVTRLYVERLLGWASAARIGLEEAPSGAPSPDSSPPLGT